MKKVSYANVSLNNLSICAAVKKMAKKGKSVMSTMSTLKSDSKKRCEQEEKE